MRAWFIPTYVALCLYCSFIRMLPCDQAQRVQLKREERHLPSYFFPTMSLLADYGQERK